MSLRLAAVGSVVVVLCAVVGAWVDISVGRLHLIGAVAFVGLLVVIAGGVVALIAIRGGDRSVGVVGALVVSLFALLLVVAQLAVDVP